MVADPIFAQFSEWAAPNREVDFPFWYRLAYSADEPILVVGADAKRIAAPLAEYGMRTLAVVPPEAPTSAASTPSSDQPLTVVSADIRTDPLPSNFGLALFPANAFLQILAPDEQRATLSNVRRHLRLGGRLGLALFVPDLSMLAAYAGPEAGVVRYRATLPAESTRPELAIYEHRSVFPAEQIIEQILIAEEITPDGRVGERRRHCTRQAYLWPREMRLLLESAGFQVEALYGNYRSDVFAADSREQIWVARKMEE